MSKSELERKTSSEEKEEQIPQQLPSEQSITTEPSLSSPMEASPQRTVNDENHLAVEVPKYDENSHSDSESEMTYSSGYDSGKYNECGMFCIDCLTCFGALDFCLPNGGEGCLSNTVTFIGNIFLGCCKR